MAEASSSLDQPYSDALVFFGATGDLAYKQIFPSLQKLAKRGKLPGPVIGVAKAGWNLDQFKARAKDSVEKHGGLDPVGFPILLSKLRYVDGDYKDPQTFVNVRQELGRPLLGRRARDHRVQVRGGALRGVVGAGVSQHGGCGKPQRAAGPGGRAAYIRRFLYDQH